MTAGRALALVAIASLLPAAACRRRGPAVEPLPEPAATFESRIVRGDDPARAPLLTQKALTPELKKLVDEGHAHAAVGSLEAAGCDLALVLTRGAYNRFDDLRYGTKMPAPATKPVEHVVWCQSRSAAPPDCGALAGVFVRVARPKQRFQVFSGFNDPPFAPRCNGEHDAKGNFLWGEGPGYGPR